MKVQLLPSSIALPFELQPLTSFLINDAVSVDGGSLGFALGLEQQRLIHKVIVTHCHIDHIASLPVFIAEVFPFLQVPVYVYATKQVIHDLREHVFNDKIWPDFHKLKLLNANTAGLEYVEITHLVPFETEDLRFTPVWMNHTIPTIGLAVEDERSAVIFTSDTYHTEDIWRLANSLDRLRAVFVDVSYPNEMQTLAADSKHLTPSALKKELAKLHKDVPVYAVHLKPQFRRIIVDELRRLNRSRIQVAEIGRQYDF